MVQREEWRIVNSSTVLDMLKTLNDAIVTLKGKAKACQTLVDIANKENRDITDKEIDSILPENDVIRIALNDAILKSRVS
jgi:hypothetical protein